jgi:hypothetical protein
MKRLLMLAFCACAVFLPRGADPSAADEGVETLAGTLSYVSEPDVSLCFCGSFRLSVEASLGECYLVSDAIDLGAYAGQRVLVYGKSFSGLCSGTVARPCSYFDVRKIVPFTRTEVVAVDWGFVKSICR